MLIEYRMRLIRNILYMSVVLFLMGCNNHENLKKKHNKQEIIDIEQQRVDALLQNDMETLTKIMHPNAVHISSNGSRATRQQWLAGRKKSTVPFETFTLNNDQTIRFYKNIAIIDGSYTNSRRLNDSITPLKHARYTRVYKKIKQKGWQMITHQATELQ